MDERKRLYLAYGSNINLTQMKYRCPAAVPLMPAELKDYTLAFRGGGVATILPEKDSFVPCLLWSITPACEQSLDRYEGYPNLYHKEMVTITIPHDNKPIVVMAYVMDEKNKEPCMPPDFYYWGIMEGYEQNGMDTKPLEAALKRTWQEIRKCKEQMPIWAEKKPDAHCNYRESKDMER